MFVLAGPPVSRAVKAIAVACKIRHIFADRRGAAGADGRARRQQCRRAGGAAGRRQDHARAAGPARRAVGEGQEDPRAGAAPAGRARRGRAHGGDAGRAGRRHRRPARALRLEGVASARASRSSPKACSPGLCSTIRRSRASPRCCSTNSTSARSMPILASRWRATRSWRCATTCKLLVMSATLDGARVAALLGDAPVIESEGRAFPVETRYLGRDPRAPIERQVADAVERALRAEQRLAAGVSAGRRRNPPHRDAAAGARHRPGDRYRRALRRARRARAGPRHRAGAARPPQGRAGDVDRRDLAHHRGRARRHRQRTRRACRATSPTSG